MGMGLIGVDVFVGFVFLLLVWLDCYVGFGGGGIVVVLVG